MSSVADGQPQQSRVPSSSVANAIYQQIRRDVLSGVLPPAGRLKMSSISKHYETSIGSLREALSQLSSEGLIVFESGRGFSVRPVSLEDLLDVTRLRISLEGAALSDSIARGDDAWEAEIIRSLYMLTKVERESLHDRNVLDSAWAERHRAFHRALLAASGSSWTIRFCEILSDHAERYRGLSISSRIEARDVHGEHEQIASAAAQRRTHDALEALRAHYSKTAETVAQRCFSTGADAVQDALSSGPRFQGDR